MSKVLVFLVCICTITTWSCDENDNCNDTVCFTPPLPFMFELVDKSSGENLFTTGDLSPSDITILNLNDQSDIDFQFIDDNDINIIEIYSIGFETQIVKYSIEVASECLFTLYVDAERLSEDCCAFTRYNEIEIDGLKFELNEQSRIYKIMVE